MEAAVDLETSSSNMIIRMIETKRNSLSRKSRDVSLFPSKDTLFRGDVEGSVSVRFRAALAFLIFLAPIDSHIALVNDS